MGDHKRRDFRDLKKEEGERMNKFEYKTDICDALEELNEQRLRELWVISAKLVQEQRQEKEAE